MLLAIDIGNTNTVFAVFKGKKIVEQWRSKTIATRSADEYASFLRELFEIAGVKWKKVSDVIISSVVPDANVHIEYFCTKYINHQPVFVGKDNTGIDVVIDKPEEVGADRLVNAAAVVDEYSAPAVVIDFGTATTFDVINAQGQYAGGVIAPGVNLSVSALEEAAAKLPQVKIEKPERAVGTDTKSAMKAGIYYGYKGLIEGILVQITAEIDVEPTIIATGGLAPLFAKDIARIQHVDQDLTLKGLLKIHEQLKTAEK